MERKRRESDHVLAGLCQEEDLPFQVPGATDSTTLHGDNRLDQGWSCFRDVASQPDHRKHSDRVVPVLGFDQDAKGPELR